MKKLALSVVGLLLAATACGQQSAPDSGSRSVEANGAEFTPVALSLACDESEQTYSALTYLGPGQPTPQDAVAPFAAALDLATEGEGENTRVHGLREDGTVARTFDVTRHEDGWWPDGWRECTIPATP